MNKRKKSKKKDVLAVGPEPTAPVETPVSDSRDATLAEDQIAFSGLSLHELFEKQTRDLLDRSDLDEEQKQSILVAMSCPCCGGGAFSYTAKIRRRS
jgi:hypothetical protein